MRSATLLLGFLLTTLGALAASLSGTVTGPTGQPLAGALLTVRETQATALTDAQGRFTVRGELPASFTLVFELPGFETTERQVALGAESESLNVTMPFETLREEVVVHERLPRTETPNHLELNHLQIVATAGSMGDLFHALQMLPGVAQMDDGAGLYVRGGDVSETATYINRSYLPHPYRYETPTGGLFGAVDTFFLEGASLSAGGFPARYGNTLSGVLELNTLPRPERLALFANVGLASSAVEIATPLGRKMGLRLAGNRSSTDALFWLNPPTRTFYKNPGGYDASGELYLDSAPAGRFTLFCFRADDSTGLQLESGNFAGALYSEQANGLYSLSWERGLGRNWRAAGSLSFSQLDKTTAAGVLNLHTLDEGARSRLDLTRPTKRGILRLGFDSERLHEELTGATPKVGGDLNGTQGVLTWATRYPELRLGGYAEFETPLAPRLTLNVGARADGFREAATEGFDPRAALEYQPRAHQTVRLAWGIYHQAPAASYYDAKNGNPNLSLMRADHYVLGYTYGEEAGRLFVRLEGYDKQYSSLPLQDPVVNYASTGSGYARGFDTLVKGRYGARWEGWASYSYVHARRRWTPETERNMYPTPADPVPPDFDIPHTLQLTASGRLPAALSIGASFRLASGKPYTPVTGATPSGAGYIPIYGPINSARLPMYQRLDFSASRPFGRERLGVFRPYLGITNLLNHDNVLDYAYSFDYSQMYPASGARTRSFYFGLIFER